MLTTIVRTDTPALSCFCLQKEMSTRRGLVHTGLSFSLHVDPPTTLEGQEFEKTVQKTDKNSGSEQDGIGFKEHALHFIHFSGSASAHRSRGLLVHGVLQYGVHLEFNHGNRCKLDDKRQSAI
jgi:hypothetical protein